MADQIFDNGDQYVAQLVANEIDADMSWDFGLFDNTVDDLQGGAVEADITTEPDQGEYTREPVDFPGDVTTTDGVLSIDNITFNTQDTGPVDVNGVFAVGSAGLIAAWVITSDGTPEEISETIAEVQTGELTITWD